MQSLSTAVRAAVIVLGIAALAALINRLVADSGLRLWLLMKQQSLPGSLWAASAVEHFTYALAVLLVGLLVAKDYWRELLPARLSLPWLVACFAMGIAFAVVLNHPMHELLFDAFFGKPQLAGGAVSDTIAASIFSQLSTTSLLLSLPAFATILLTPLVEELTDRGILFREAASLPAWQIAVLSFLVFCFSHFAIGGMAKVLAVVPAALLFIGVRLKTGSFLYSAAAHTGVNLTATLKLQALLYS